MTEQEESLKNARRLKMLALRNSTSSETILITWVLGKESIRAISKRFKKFNIGMSVMTDLMVLQDGDRIEILVVLRSSNIMEENQTNLAEEEMEVLLKDLMFPNIQILIVFSLAPTR